jgi:hypothetical protein
MNKLLRDELGDVTFRSLRAGRPYKKGTCKAMSATLYIRVDVAELVLAVAVILHELMHK